MPDAPETTAPASRRDWARQPLAIIFWCGLPIGVAALADVLRLPFRAGAAVCAAAFAWMAVGCVLNAVRCHRLHCYISGPLFLAGAILAGLVATGVADLDAPTLVNAVGAILVLALLSFVPEMVWKRYA